MSADSSPQCPFLGQSMEARTLICLADIEPVAVSRRYGDSYCLTPGHVNCSLYISAVLANRSNAPPILDRVEIVAEQVPRVPATEPAAPETTPATAAETTQLPPLPTPPLTRAQAIELAQDLGRSIEELVRRVRERRAANDALLRKMRTLEEMAENPAFLRRVLATGERQSIDTADLNALQGSLQALLRNPNDLNALVLLANQSPKLEQAVGACIQLFRARG